MTPELDPDGWFPDRECHEPPRVRAPYRVRFLRRKADRRRLRAVVLQCALTAILCGAVTITAAAADMAADRQYDGTPDRKAPGFCYVASPPPGVARCHGAEVQP